MQRDRGALLDERDYELVASLTLSPRRRLGGFAPGEQRRAVQGGGLEFADYREYRPGDDIRGIDWTVFLRFRKLLVKVRAEERELSLVLLLDLSGSMAFGDPSKLLLARRTAFILAGIALAGGNRAGISVLGRSLREALKPERTKIALPELAQLVSRIRRSDFAESEALACSRRFAARFGGKCVAVLISDLLFPGWGSVLEALAASGADCHLVQILAPEEFEPLPLGEATLVDLEDGNESPIHLDSAAVLAYRRELRSFLREVDERCGSLGLGRFLLSSNADRTRVFREDFRRGGLLC